MPIVNTFDVQENKVRNLVSIEIFHRKTAAGISPSPSTRTIAPLPCMDMYPINFPLLPPAKRSLRRLCFYTCLSFILFTGGGRGGWYPSMQWANPPPDGEPPPSPPQMENHHPPPLDGEPPLGGEPPPPPGMENHPPSPPEWRTTTTPPRMENPPRDGEPPPDGHCAGGTHPTGMHSC